MSAPAMLRLHQWKGPEVSYRITAWRPDEGLVFCSGGEEEKRVLQLASAGGQPFGAAVPVEISAIRLLPPPCRSNLQEAQMLRQRAQPSAENKADEAAIATLLDRLLSDRRQEYMEQKSKLLELQPFGAALPVEIAGALPPPCRSNEQESELLRQNAASAEKKAAEASFGTVLDQFMSDSRQEDMEGKEPESETFRQNAQGGAGNNQPTRERMIPGWEIERLRYDPEILYPARADEASLATALERVLSDRRQEYEERKAELSDLLVLARSGRSILGRARYYSEFTSLAGEYLVSNLKQESIRLELDFPKGCLLWTIADAYRRPSIRNPILRKAWAVGHGISLEELDAQRREFLKAIPAPAAKTLPILTRRDVLGRIMGFPQCYRPLNDTHEFCETFGGASGEELEHCAKVQYVVRFSDGSRYWLTNCSIREPLNHLELQEFAPIAVSQQFISQEEACAQLSRIGSRAGNCKPATLARYCKHLEIDRNKITVADMDRLKSYRLSLQKRVSLRKLNKQRYRR